VHERAVGANAEVPHWAAEETVPAEAANQSQPYRAMAS
jgi:hypothetical protein